MTDGYPIPADLRYHPPTPRPVPVLADEHHCAANCTHLREAWRRGFADGARTERARQESALGGRIRSVGAFLFGALLGLVLPSLVAWALGGR